MNKAFRYILLLKAGTDENRANVQTNLYFHQKKQPRLCQSEVRTAFSWISGYLKTIPLPDGQKSETHSTCSYKLMLKSKQSVDIDGPVL